MGGFESWKDLLDIVAIPIVLSLLAVFWPWQQVRQRRKQFESLIEREIEELSPYPHEPLPGGEWWLHQTRAFVHPQIFRDVTGNRDFILSLDPELVYWVTQLWQSLEVHDATQWIHYLKSIEGKYDCGTNSTAWSRLIDSYGRQSHSSD